MTNEETINRLNSMKNYYNDRTEPYYVGFDYKDNDALDMAIKALEQQPCETIHGSTYGGVSWGGTYKPQQPCEDCINRTELLSRIDAERKHLLNIKMDGAEHIIVHHARRIIEDMPSVTPTKPKGKWIQTKDNCDGVNFYDFSFECTECGKEQSFKSNYCPNCGADMSESEE